MKLYSIALVLIFYTDALANSESDRSNNIGQESKCFPKFAKNRELESSGHESEPTGKAKPPSEVDAQTSRVSFSDLRQESENHRVSRQKIAFKNLIDVERSWVVHTGVMGGEETRSWGKFIVFIAEDDSLKLVFQGRSLEFHYDFLMKYGPLQGMLPPAVDEVTLYSNQNRRAFLGAFENIRTVLMIVPILKKCLDWLHKILLSQQSLRKFLICFMIKCS